jgi:hypothetical protein
MKFLVSLLTLALTANLLFAQKPSVGIIGGVGYSGLSATLNYPGKYTERLSIMTNVQIKLNNLIQNTSLEVNPGFAARGAVIKSEGVKSSMALNYLTLPVLFSTPMKNKRITVSSGPEFGYLLSAFGRIDNNPKVKIDEMRHFDFAGVAMASASISESLSLGIKSYLGFLSTSDKIEVSDKDGNHLGSLKTRNYGLYLFTSYRFN